MVSHFFATHSSSVETESGKSPLRAKELVPGCLDDFHQRTISWLTWPLNYSPFSANLNLSQPFGNKNMLTLFKMRS